MKFAIVRVAILMAMLFTGGCGNGNGSSPTPPGPPPPPPPPPAGLSSGPAVCAAGLAADFTCSGISLRKRIANADMGGGDGNDIWGWADPQTGKEYALMGLTTGTAFVDVSDPEQPVIIGQLPTNTIEALWRDIKVFNDHAFVVADNAGAHGLQVFDLTRLRGVAPGQTFTADAIYNGFENAHNIAINEATGFLYAVGTNTCNGGLHVVDISTPTSPIMAGCYDAVDTHDTECVIYQGPDPDYTGREICFSSNGDSSSNGDHIGIVDVTDKTAMTAINSVTYPESGFAHQGWLTEDQRFFLLGDELDERDLGVPTRTLIFDFQDLDAPLFVSAYEAPTTSIDHNLYILGNRVFEANYTSGVRALEFQDLSNSEISEIAFFDTFPDNDLAVFDGVWSVYPYLPSGNIIASDISNGLFILTMQ